MNKILYTFLTVGLFLSVTLNSYAQEKNSLLSDYIQFLEKKFDVKFSNNPKELETISIKINAKNITLHQILDDLNKQTRFNFIRLDKRYIAIQKQEIEQLNTVFINKYLTTGIKKAKDGRLTITTKKFGALPGLTNPDVLQSLKVLPGIETENESINYISVRGGKNHENLILWDGIKMYHSSHFFGLISAYNPYLTRHTTVIKNGTDSEFSGGVSSTLKIQTNNKIHKKISGGFGSDLLSSDVYFEIPISKKFEIDASFRRSITDQINTTIFKSFFNKSVQNTAIELNDDNNFYFTDFSVKALYNINPKNKIRFTTLHILNQLNYRDTTEDEDFRESNLEQQKTAIGLQWFTTWNKVLSFKVNAYHTQYTINSFDSRSDFRQSIFQKNEITENYLKIKNTFKINTTTSLHSGITIQETGILNSTDVSIPVFKNTNKQVLISSALFSQLKTQINNINLNLGVRINHLQKFNKFLIEPRFNFNYQLNRFWNYKILGELNHQTTLQTVDLKNNFLSLENRRWILVDNDRVPILKSQQISTGAHFKNRNYLVEFTTFYKKVDGISSIHQGFRNQLSELDVKGKYTNYGIELLVNRVSKKTSIWASYTFNNNNFTFQNLSPTTIPNDTEIVHSINTGFNYHFTKKLTFSLGVNWNSGTSFTNRKNNPETVTVNGLNRINFNLPNHDFLDPFLRTDVTLKYQFNFTERIKGNLNISTLNTFRKKNINKRYFKIENSEVQQVEQQSLSFSPNLSFRVYF